MPTAYTSDLYEGKPQTFQEFAFECARAMGALIMMRDEPLGTPLRRFEPSDYHIKALAEAEERLVKYGAMTLTDAATERRIAYHTAKHAEEVERTNGRNEWVRALAESLGAAVPS